MARPLRNVLILVLLASVVSPGSAQPNLFRRRRSRSGEAVRLPRAGNRSGAESRGETSRGETSRGETSRGETSLGGTRSARVRQPETTGEDLRRPDTFDLQARSRRLRAQAADLHARRVVEFSQRDGRYLIVSDLHWGLGRSRDADSWHAEEEFRRPEVFASLVRSLRRRQKNTLLIAGDWLELAGRIGPDASLSDVSRALRGILRGHQLEVRALVRATIDEGLRIGYLLGNHDPHLVDPRLRRLLAHEMLRVAGVETPRERVVFRQRFAYVGQAAALGRYGEALVLHGHVQDPSNSWRSVMNPYDQHGRMQTNFGWEMVDGLVRAARGRSSETGAIARHLRTRQGLGDLGAVLGGFAARRREASEDVRERMEADDRAVTLSWAQRSGFAAAMNRVLPGERRRAQSSSEWAGRLESVFRRLPPALQERMNPGTSWLGRAWNLARLAYWAPRYSKRLRQVDASFVRTLQRELPNVRYVVAGHTHNAEHRLREDNGREVGYANTGTWTRVGGEWRLHVTVAETDPEGRLRMRGLFRAAPDTGALEPH